MACLEQCVTAQKVTDWGTPVESQTNQSDVQSATTKQTADAKGRVLTTNTTSIRIGT